MRAVDHLAVFRTSENALMPGWHEWETNYNQAGQGLRGADWHATGLSCQTTQL